MARRRNRDLISHARRVGAVIEHLLRALDVEAEAAISRLVRDRNLGTKIALLLAGRLEVECEIDQYFDERAGVVKENDLASVAILIATLIEHIFRPLEWVRESESGLYRLNEDRDLRTKVALLMAGHIEVQFPSEQHFGTHIPRCRTWNGWYVLDDKPSHGPFDRTKIRCSSFMEREDEGLVNGKIMRERAADTGRSFSLGDGVHMLGEDGRGGEIPHACRGKKIVLAGTPARDGFGVAFVPILVFWGSWEMSWKRLDEEWGDSYVLPELVE